MRYYQEITLLADAEIPAAYLWTKVFTQLHLAMAAALRRDGAGRIGISFPGYGEKTLGMKLRLFAEEQETLEALGAENALCRLQDYVHLTGVRKIPEGRLRGHAVYSRVQPDASVERKARRYARRHEDTTYEAALALLSSKAKDAALPYIQLKSLSTGEKFSLFIRRAEKEETAGDFTAYGLSREATVPEF